MIRISNLNQRIQELSALLLDPRGDGNLDMLLDVFLGVFEECKLIKSTKGSFIFSFLERFDPIAKKITSLRLGKTDFEQIKLIARGFFGDVFLVRSRLDGLIYAMKVMPKQRMLKRHEMISFIEEKNLMVLADSNWITKLKFSFQDDSHLYLVMEYLPGGDMMSYLCKKDILDEESARFYIAETIMAVNEIHALNYVHRDIKPDNILIDADGHIKLTDFGSCIRLDSDSVVRSNIAVGTPGYVSPEILRAVEGKTSYGKECDWWSVGVVLYEMVVGETPFDSENITLMNSKIMSGGKAIKFPEDIELTPEIKDLIIKLLDEKDHRLGKNGIREIIDHDFFKSVCWTSLREQTPPFIPKINGPTDTSNFEYAEEEEEVEIAMGLNGTKTFLGENFPFIGFSYDGQLSANHRFSSDISMRVLHDKTDSDDLESTKTTCRRDPMTTGDQSLLVELEKCERKFKEEKKKVRLSESINHRLMETFQNALKFLGSHSKDVFRLETGINGLMRSLSILETELYDARSKYLQEQRAKCETEERLSMLQNQLHKTLDEKTRLFNTSHELENVKESMSKTAEELRTNLQLQLAANKRQLEFLNDAQKEKAMLVLELKEINYKFITESRIRENLEVKIQNLQVQFEETISTNARLTESKNQLEEANKLLIAKLSSAEQSIQRENSSHQEKDLQLSQLRKSAAMFELRMHDLAKRYEAVLNEKQGPELFSSKSEGLQEQAGFFSDLNISTHPKVFDNASLKWQFEDQLKTLNEEKIGLECEISEIRKQLVEEAREKSTILENLHELQTTVDREMSKRAEYSDAFAELKAANLALSHELKILGEEFEEELMRSHETTRKMKELELARVALELEIFNAKEQYVTEISAIISMERLDIQTNRSRCYGLHEQKGTTASLKDILEQQTLLQTDVITLRSTLSEISGLREKFNTLSIEFDESQSNHITELANLTKKLDQETQSREIAESRLMEVSKNLENEISRGLDLKIGYSGLAKEKDSIEEKLREFEQQYLAESARNEELLQETQALKTKSELQQVKIDAVVSKFEGTLSTMGEGAKSVLSEKSDWQDKRAQKMKAQELKWLRQKFDQEIEKNKLLESQILDIRLTKQQFEKELDDLKKTNGELRRQISQVKRSSVDKYDEFSEIKQATRQDVSFFSENRLSLALNKAKSSLLSSITSSNDSFNSLSQIEGWIKVPRTRGIKFGWKRKYAGVINFKLYLVDDPKQLHEHGFLEWSCDLRSTLFASRAASPKEMYAGSQLMFAIFWNQLRDPKTSYRTTMSIIEDQAEILHFGQEVHDSKTQALQRKVVIESKLVKGAENFLKVAVGDQRTKALRELEESRIRLEAYQALLSAYETYSNKDSIRSNNISSNISSTNPDFDDTETCSEFGSQNANGHEFRLIDTSSQLTCHQCHDRIGNTHKHIFECVCCGFLCHLHCSSCIFLSCLEITNLQHGQVLYIMTDDEAEKSRWLKSLELLRIMAIADCNSITK